MGSVWLIPLIVLADLGCCQRSAIVETSQSPKVLHIRVANHVGVDREDPERARVLLNGAMADYGLRGVRKALAAVRQLPPGSDVIVDYDQPSNTGSRFVFVDLFSAYERREDLLELIEERGLRLSFVRNGHPAAPW